MEEDDEEDKPPTMLRMNSAAIWLDAAMAGESGSICDRDHAGGRADVVAGVRIAASVGSGVG